MYIYVYKEFIMKKIFVKGVYQGVQEDSRNSPGTPALAVSR